MRLSLKKVFNGLHLFSRVRLFQKYVKPGYVLEDIPSGKGSACGQEIECGQTFKVRITWSFTAQFVFHERQIFEETVAHSASL